MVPENVSADLAFANALDLPASDDERLLLLSLLILAIQAQLASSPGFATNMQGNDREQGRSFVEQGVDWQRLADGWWSAQKQSALVLPTLRLQLFQLYMLELRLHALNEPSNKARIDAFFAAGETGGVTGQVLVRAGEFEGRLPGCLVMAHELEGSVDAGRDFILYGLGFGVWLDSDPANIAQRLQSAIEEGQPWTAVLPEALQQALFDGKSLTFEFHDPEQSLTVLMLEDLRTLQRHLVEDLLTNSDEGAVSLLALNAAVRLEDWVDRLKVRSTRLLASRRHQHEPHWMRDLEGEDLKGYRALEQGGADKEQELEAALGHLRNFRTFANHQVVHWLETDERGLKLSPELTRLEVRFTTLPGAAQYECSVLDWVCNGGYEGDLLWVQAGEPQLQGRLTQGYLQRMVLALDLHADYYASVRDFYLTTDSQKRLRDVISSQAALLALRARYAAVLSADAYELFIGELQERRADVKQVLLRGVPLREAYCLRQGDLVILYTPGAPGGDFQHLPDISNVPLAVNEVRLHPGGNDYLVAQMPLAERSEQQKYLTRLGEHLVPRDEITLEDLERDFVSTIHQAKVLTVLDDVRKVFPKWYAAADYETRQRLMYLDTEVKYLQQEHRASNQIKSIREFTYPLALEKLNEYLGDQVAMIDPDTVMVTADAEPMTFTDAMMRGYAADFNFSEFGRIHSTLKQDLSQLNIPLLGSAIRRSSSEIRAKYTEYVNREFLDEQRPARDRQYRVHHLLLSRKMRRDCLAASLEGYLGASHSNWLRTVYEGLAERDYLKEIDFAEFAFDRTFKRGVERVYLLGNPDGGDVIYFSDVVGGRALRTRADVAESWRYENLGDYFYNRVAYTDQPAIGTLINEQISAGDGIAVITEAISYRDFIRDFNDDFDKRVRRQINDAREQTTSFFDRVRSSFIELLELSAAIVTAPVLPLSFAVGLAITTRSLVRGALAWRSGDKSAAAVYFVLGGLGLAGSAWQGHKLLSQLLGNTLPAVNLNQLKSALLDGGWPLAKNGFGDVSMEFSDELLSLIRATE